MLYLSAQPDQLYFVWQLEIQLRNLLSLGITKMNIQVLVAYNQDLGINPDFEQFIERNNHLAQFYIYPDLREKPKYTSSVRPNILKQHFEKYPELSKATIMYHDSDIIFTRIPEIENVEQNDICYVSDTRNYLDLNYIVSTSNEELLDEMLAAVGLSKEKLIEENEQTGGAQYILKGITANFWRKVEQDSESLYFIMSNFNRALWEREYPIKKNYRSKKRGIQSWCADMWAVLWNLWLDNKKVKIHSELEFSWPYSPIEDWNRLAIQHYSGNIEDKKTLFKKTEYLNYTPWYDSDLDCIPDSTCSYEIVNLIKNRRMELDKLRISFPSKVILLKEEKNDEKTRKLFTYYRNYISKYLDIQVYYLYDDKNAGCVIYKEPFSEESIEIVNSDCDYLILPVNLLIPIHEIESYLQQKVNQYFSVSNVFVSDVLFSEAFSKILDIRLLTENKGKLNEIEFFNCVEFVDSNCLVNKVLEEKIHCMDAGKACKGDCFLLQ